MLERFHVPEDIAVRVPQEEMRATVEAIFQEMGMSEADARQAADVLMYADLRGIESHGVSNMMRLYVTWFREGIINPTPEPKILHESRRRGDDGFGSRTRPGDRTAGHEHGY